MILDVEPTRSIRQTEVGAGLVAGSIKLKLVSENVASGKLGKLKDKGRHNVSAVQGTVSASAPETTTQTKATYTTKGKKKNCMGKVWDPNLTKMVCPD